MVGTNAQNLPQTTGNPFLNNFVSKLWRSQYPEVLPVVLDDSEIPGYASKDELEGHQQLVTDQFTGTYKGKATLKKYFQYYDFSKATEFITLIRSGKAKGSENTKPNNFQQALQTVFFFTSIGKQNEEKPIRKDIPIVILNSYAQDYSRQDIYDKLIKEYPEQEETWNKFLEEGEVSEQARELIIKAIKKGIFNLNKDGRKVDLAVSFSELEKLTQLKNVYVYTSAGNSPEAFNLLSLASGVKTVTEPDEGHSRSQFVQIEFPGNMIQNPWLMGQTSAASPGFAGEDLSSKLSLTTLHEGAEYKDNIEILQKAIKGSGINIAEKYSPKMFKISAIEQKDKDGNVLPSGNKVISIIDKHSQRIVLKYWSSEEGLAILEYGEDRKVQPLAFETKQPSLSKDVLGSIRDLEWLAESKLALNYKKSLIVKLIDSKALDHKAIAKKASEWVPLFTQDELQSIALGYLQKQALYFCNNLDFWGQLVKDSNITNEQIETALRSAFQSQSVRFDSQDNLLLFLKEHFSLEKIKELTTQYFYSLSFSSDMLSDSDPNSRIENWKETAKAAGFTTQEMKTLLIEMIKHDDLNPIEYLRELPKSLEGIIDLEDIRQAGNAGQLNQWLVNPGDRFTRYFPGPTDLLRNFWETITLNKN
jgi:hypothetical protein